MTQTEKAIAEIHQWMAKYGPVLDGLVKEIWGNGQPGLKTEVTEIRTRQQECQSRRRDLPALIIAGGALVVAMFEPFIAPLMERFIGG